MYSDEPTGYEKDEDPFTYYGGGSRRVMSVKSDMEESDETFDNVPAPLRNAKTIKINTDEAAVDGNQTELTE